MRKENLEPSEILDIIINELEKSKAYETDNLVPVILALSDYYPMITAEMIIIVYEEHKKVFDKKEGT